MGWPALARLALVATLAAAALLLEPLGSRNAANLALGAGAGLLVVAAAEARLRRAGGFQILGGLLGAAAGLVVANLISGALALADGDDRTFRFLHALVLVSLAYTGAVVGVRRAEWLEPARLVRLFRDAGPQRRYKILDTSVIIDGRIADVCEAGFLEGTLVVPQFVLKELQLVADSTDPLKRNRGRRGLDILQKIQKMAGVEVTISDVDYPEIRDVDLKLIELARSLQGKIVTNDFNL
ncbi:MAG TPA: PIN/TRAM domain-containing protein, partial [Vicinamibacterales bacterium]|nr:PIN/TRAM domain-containing protein [Vicinamibacterales bacterium]